MLLKYKPKLEHIKIVPLIAVSTAAKAVKLSRNQVQLLPGTNEITDDEWLVIKDHVKRELDAGIIVVVEKTSSKAPDGKAKNLKDMPTKDAVELVEGCNNPETLIKWYNEEIRDEVRVLIVEKMKELKVDIPKRASSGGNDDKPKVIEEMTKDELVAYAAEKKITITATGTAEAILAEIKKAEAK
jgi:hypothetical protein